MANLEPKVPRYHQALWIQGCGEVKVIIPKINGIFQKKPKEGKKKVIYTALNEMMYTELILSINDKTRSQKAALHLVKRTKNKRLC